MYQALYRKWRPKTFDEVVGQEHITETLKRQLECGRLSHAYLFVGTRGTGKTTCAKILAKAVNCEHPVNGNPCNQCASCLGIDSGSILDVEELDAASNNGVDNIRALRDEAIYTPAAVRKRVYIVDEVHMLSMQAFNALLKILEEPPQHLIFILATTELNKVPATILSRCQRYTFKRLTPDLIASRLLYVAGQEKISLTEDAALLLGRLAEGSMRDGLSLLDQCNSGEVINTEHVLSTVGLTGAEDTKKILSAVIAGDTAGAMQLVDRLYYGGKELGTMLEGLLKLCRDILILGAAPQSGTALLSGNYSPAELKEFAEKAPLSRYLYDSRTLQSAIAELSRSFDRRLTAEMCLMQLCDDRLGEDASSLSVRVERLENVLRSGEIQTPAAERKMTAAQAEKKEPTAQAKEKTPEAPEKLPETPESISLPEEPLKPEVERECADSGDLWKKILAAAKPEMELGAFSVLSDSLHAEAEIRGGKLTVKAKNAFAVNMFNKSEVKSALAKAASAVLGMPTPVQVTASSGETRPDTGKLDALKQEKFSGIIKFQ